MKKSIIAAVIDLFVYTGSYISVWVVGAILEIEFVEPGMRISWETTTWYGYALLVASALGVIMLPWTVKGMIERWGRS